MTTKEQLRLIEHAVACLTRVAEARDPERKHGDQAANLLDGACAKSRHAWNVLTAWKRTIEAP